MPKSAARSSRLPAADTVHARFVAEMKTRIGAARLSAARSVNRELILLTWDIRREIVERQTVECWGRSGLPEVLVDSSNF